MSSSFGFSMSALRVLHRTVRAGLVLSILASGVACGGLLDVSDPTLVQDKDIANPAGANARRLDAVVIFNFNVSSLANDVAVFTDELMVDLPDQRYVSQEPYYTDLDRRDSEGWEARYTSTTQYQDPHLGGWDDVITRAGTALPAIRAYAPDSLRGEYLGQLYAIRGYAMLQMAEDICPGFPINDIVDNRPLLGLPLTTDSAISLAMAQADSALKYAHDSTRFVNLARVVKGRALLDLGRYAEAAAAVTDVPQDFTYTNAGVQRTNNFYVQQYFWDAVSGNPGIHLAVGERQGGTGEPFVSANDPRVPTVYEQVRYHSPDSLYDQLKYRTDSDPFVIASGIEAKLMMAEAALSAGDPSWFAILNQLRATAISPAMSAIATLPSVTADQVDLLYHERAFWLYLTGRRLGDLRRLIRNYGRAANTVFPTGHYPMLGLEYGTGTAIPFIFSSQQHLHPQITSGCTTR